MTVLICTRTHLCLLFFLHSSCLLADTVHGNTAWELKLREEPKKFGVDTAVVVKGPVDTAATPRANYTELERVVPQVSEMLAKNEKVIPQVSEMLGKNRMNSTISNASKTRRRKWVKRAAKDDHHKAKQHEKKSAQGDKDMRSHTRRKSVPSDTAAKVH